MLLRLDKEREKEEEEKKKRHNVNSLLAHRPKEEERRGCE